MYTVIVNDDKSLTTSILEKLIGDNTNTIQFLMRSYASESDSDNEDDQSVTPNIQIVYSADLHYKTGGLEKAVRLVTDSNLYKERVRFVLPSYSVFWNHRGVIEYWLDITIETITTSIDESTGLNVVSRSTQYVVTYPTTLLIDGSPFNKCRWKGECNTIFVTRGDSKQVKIALTDDEGYPYEPEVGDELWFRVKKTAYMEDILIEKQIDNSTLIIDLVEMDTENLEFGEYRYEVELITEGGDHYTVIKNTPFIIGKELG